MMGYQMLICKVHYNSSVLNPRDPKKKQRVNFIFPWMETSLGQVVFN